MAVGNWAGKALSKGCEEHQGGMADQALDETFLQAMCAAIMRCPIGARPM